MSGADPRARGRAWEGARGVARRSAAAAGRRLVVVLGGPRRTRVIVVLACVLALSSADTATVGASAIELRRGLGIDNTDIGLLVAVTSVVGAVFSLPFGALADRVRRTFLLGVAVLTWAAAMVWSATATSFGQLLEARVFLGAVTAAAGPAVASLVGDYFASGERGRVYSYVLTGELLGAGVGFTVTGDLAALSWRLAFVILAIPALVVAWLVFALPEPRRGGQEALVPDAPAGAVGQSGRPPPPPEETPGADGSAPNGVTDAQQLALDRHVAPDLRLARRAWPGMRFMAAVRYVLRVRTNLALVVSGACGYYFLAGVQTFGVEFVRDQYAVGQVLANFLLLVVGAGAVLGVVGAGPLGDALLRRGYLRGRVMVAAVSATLAVGLLVPALVTHSAFTALPYIVVAAGALSAQNPPIDAARLDIMPAWLWGRAEGVRTFLRTGAQALAPLLFGAVSDYVFGGGHTGLRWTFVVMLVPLAASAFILYRAAGSYPADVATAAVAQLQGDGAATGRERPRR